MNQAYQSFFRKSKEIHLRISLEVFKTGMSISFPFQCKKYEKMAKHKKE